LPSIVDNCGTRHYLENFMQKYDIDMIRYHRKRRFMKIASFNLNDPRGACAHRMNSR